MTDNFLVKVFEHNNWANQQVIQACLALNDEQLDAPPQSVTMGTIRQTLTHLVSAQRGYLALLTLPREARPTNPLALAELQESARMSGEGLLALVRGEGKEPLQAKVQSRDGNFVESWVVLVQVINHATEHREQIKSMLSSLGVTPPDIDGWDYGEVTKALIPISDNA
jgi:uncharacterized damage-inducible protein DinB